MKPDIRDLEDIKFLVNSFYEQVVMDEVIGHFFTKVVPLNMNHHLPIMYQFWETVLLAKAAYKGNPVKKHVELHQKAPLNEAHFKQWLKLWESTIDRHYEGTVADEAKQKALTMKELMLAKIKFMENPDAIQ